MKPIYHAIIGLLLAAAPGAVCAAEPVQWDANRPEFKFFQEKGSYTEDAWDQLAPEDQEKALEEVKDKALEREKLVLEDYSYASQKWDSRQAKFYTDKIRNEELKVFYIWVGKEEGQELNRKVSFVRDMLAKASTEEGLTDEDAAALSRYLIPEAINDLRALKTAAGVQRQAAAAAGRQDPGKAAVNASLDKASGAASKANGKDISKFFDGSAGNGDVSDPVYSKKYALPKGVVGSAVGGISGSMSKQVAGAADDLLAPNGTSATTVKSAPPAALGEAKTKSKALTSDAYGITLETGAGVKTFRKPKEAEAAIRELPPGSVKKIILYGHGAPGLQSVGDNSYDAESTTALLKGKMAKDGVIQFAGCNTASIGGPTLNPAVGLSMVARRLLYFSVPYFLDRKDGRNAEDSKQEWEKTWNADLARDTSNGVKGAIVCGYRTFGLVPGRLPVVTRLMGTQEATTPGYVAGKKACYQDGKEVPAP